MYSLYLLRCADGTLYTGITTDVVRRVQEHNTSALGARYTRGRRPVRLLGTQTFRDRSQASIAEARVKRLTRAEKLAYIKKR